MTWAWLLRRTVLDLRRQAVALAGVAAAFALAALLLGGYRLGAARDPREAAAALTGGPPAQVIAYLRDDLERQATRRLRDVLGQLPGVQHVAIVNGEEALARLRRQLGERARMLDGTDDGLWPTSLEVWLSPGGDPITRARQLAWRLRRIDGIVDVDAIDARADERVDGWMALLGQKRRVLLAVAALGTVAALLLAARAGRRQRRQELRVLLALGFTRRASLGPGAVLVTIAALVGGAVGLGAAQIAWRMTAAASGGTVGLSLADVSLGLLAAVGLGLLMGVATAVGRDVEYG